MIKTLYFNYNSTTVHICFFRLQGVVSPLSDMGLLLINNGIVVVDSSQ